MPHRSLRLGRSALVLAFCPRCLGVVLIHGVAETCIWLGCGEHATFDHIAWSCPCHPSSAKPGGLASTYRLVLGGLRRTLGLTWWLFNLGWRMCKRRFGRMFIQLACIVERRAVASAPLSGWPVLFVWFFPCLGSVEVSGFCWAFWNKKQIMCSS